MKKNREIAAGLNFGVTMLAAIFVGGLIGYLLDNWLGTKPILLIVFMFLGIGAGFRNFYLEITRDEKDGK